MKIGYISDLHIDHWGNREYKPKIEYLSDLNLDILIIAGDIYCSQNNKLDKNHNHKIRNKFIKKFESILKCPIIYVYGNHDYYFDTIENTLNNKNTAGIFLQNSTYEIPNTNIKIIGSTLWSMPDISKYNLLKYFSDFKYIKNFSIEDNIKLHLESVEFLKSEFKKDDNKRIIVISHHSPSWKALNIKYINNDFNSLYNSNLDNFILTYQPELWIYGHHHDPNDFYINKTRIVCNSYGYPWENPSRFIPIKILNF